MKKLGIQTLILLSFLFGLSNCKKEASNVIYSKAYIEEIKAARKDVRYFIASNFIPGASVTVIKNGEVIYSDAFGYASRDLDVPATRQTKFRIGSLSELFTNVIYQKMVDEKILHPDSSIQTYYPEFPEKEQKLTLNHLVQQTSGIREMHPGEDKSMNINVSLAKGINLFKDEPLYTTPGDYQTESSFNYNLLGVVMEKATKKHFHQLLKDYVTDTLKLQNTIIDNPLITIKNRSSFYDHNYIAQVVNATTLDLRYRGPSDGMLSTSEDLAKLGLAVLRSDYLSKETRESLFEPIPLLHNIPSTMANSWMLLNDNKGRKLYGKSSGITGGGSAILMYPEEDLIITYTCNLTSTMDNTPVFSVAQHFLPAPETTNAE